MELPHQEVDVFYFLFLATFLMFILSGAVVLFFVLYQKKLFRQRLKVQELEARHQQALLYGNLEQVEEERKRIAKDLHDEIGSLFSTLGIRLIQLEQSFNLEQPVLDAIQESKLLIDKGICSIRSITHNMIPPDLELFGVAAAVEELCLQVEQTGRFVVSYEIKEPREEPAPEIGLAIYRVVQELFSNTIKHAGATGMELLLSFPQGQLRLVYSDDGRGLGEQTADKLKGIGLRNIDSRVMMHNGNIRYPQQETGMQVEITIPLQERV